MSILAPPDSPFLRFLASKLGEGQVLFLLTLETVDPGTGMVLPITSRGSGNSSGPENHFSWKVLTCFDTVWSI